MEGNAVLFILVLYPMIMAAAAYVMGRKGKEGGVKAAIAAGGIEFALVAGTVLLLGKADLYVPQVCGTGFHFTLEGFRCVYAFYVDDDSLVFQRIYGPWGPQGQVFLFPAYDPWGCHGSVFICRFVYHLCVF